MWGEAIAPSSSVVELWGVRAGLVVLGLAGWFWTQRLLARHLFFSGHTAIAVYGAIELAAHGGAWGLWLGLAIAVGEAFTVLVLRAHYTMDVFAAVVTALWAAEVAWTLAPLCDRVLLQLIRG